VAHILQDVDSDFLQAGLILGVGWTGPNILLDLIVLAGLFGNELSMWFWQTGVGYFSMIPLELVVVEKARVISPPINFCAWCKPWSYWFMLL
jgi:hypothetical protein